METSEGFFIDLDESRVHVDRLLKVLDHIFECDAAHSLLAHPGRLRHVTTAQVGGQKAATRSTFGALNAGFHPADEVDVAHHHAHETILAMAFELRARAEAIRRALSATIHGYQQADQDAHATVNRALENLYSGSR